MLSHSSRPALLTLPLLAVLAAAGCDIQVGDKGVSIDVSEGKATEDWVREYTLPAGGELEIVNVNGRIELEAASGRSVEVRAERRVRGQTEDEARQMLRDNPMQEEVTPDRVRVTAVSKQEQEQESGFLRRSRVSVEFTVRVPPGLRVTLTTENGEIRIEDVEAQITASTTNGGITASGLSGGATAKTVNGGIRLEMTAVTSDIDLCITNGAARLELPANVKATLDASCINGGVDIDDDLSLQATARSRERVTGTLNGGGSRISANCVNGGIRIRARDTDPTE